MPALPNKQNILISACLLGEPVRYDGDSNLLNDLLIKQIIKKHQAIKFCPEVMGGLPTPRAAAEIVNGSGKEVLDGIVAVRNIDRQDVSREFISGAKQCLKLCQQHNISIALLKAKSPSCGNKQIYDGSFSGKLQSGEGVTAALLRENGVEVFNELELDKLSRALETSGK